MEMMLNKIVPEVSFNVVIFLQRILFLKYLQLKKVNYFINMIG